MIRTHFFIFTTGCLSLLPSKADDLPDGGEVHEAMKRAAIFYKDNLAVNGGYASEWSHDLGKGRTEHRESASIISIQPPGTTTVGLSLLKAFEASHDILFYATAKDAALALTECQLASGGWTSDFDFAPEFAKRYYLRQDLLAGDTDRGKRRDLTTLDDNKTQSAILFLTEFLHASGQEEVPEVRASLDFALEKLLAAQAPNGAWPQQFSSEIDYSDAPVIRAQMPESYPRLWPNEKYIHFYTLNDNNLLNLIQLLLRVYELEQNPAYLDSAKRCGEFLLLAQFDEPQPGWAQQYNRSMEPVWARKFEPASVCTVESLGAINALYELWLATGDSHFVERVPAALDWLERSQLENGKWARFYELKTNRPLYCDANDYSLTYEDSNLPTHYGFQIDSSFGNKLKRMRENLKKSREDILTSRKPPSTKEEWSKAARDLRKKVHTAMQEQNAEGVWKNGKNIDAKLFSKHMDTLSAYIRADFYSKIELGIKF